MKASMIKTGMICVFLLTGSGFSFALADGSFDSANQFAGELRGLKSSAEQLSAGNITLAVQNNNFRLGLSQLQERLRRLAEENNKLTRLSLRLQDINPARSHKIAQMEKEVFEIDSKIDHAAEGMKSDKETFKRLEAENAKLSEQMRVLGNASVEQQEKTVALPIAVDHQKEKLRLLKMIDQSKQRQGVIYQQIGDTQKQRTVPVVTVETSSEKDHLIRDIQRVQDEIEQIGKPTIFPADQNVWDSKELRQLKTQIKVLQKNYDELEDWIARMQEKAHKGVLTAAQSNDRSRLQASMDSINKENKKLRLDLNELRQEMVDLDKRKAYLESITRH